METRKVLSVSANPVPLVLATGEKVEDCRRDQNGVPQDALCRGLACVDGGPKHIKVAVSVAPLSGLESIIIHSGRARPIPVRRAWKPWMSHFVLVQRRRLTSRVVLILEKKAVDLYLLLVARFCSNYEPELGDEKALAREIERQMDLTGRSEDEIRPLVVSAARGFWKTHSFALGDEDVMCTRCGKVKIPKASVLAALEGFHVVCDTCFAKR